MRKLATLAAAAAALTIMATAHAKARPDAWNLQPGSTGVRVEGLQWMLSGHCPNKFTLACGGKVTPTLKAYTPRVFGARTKAGLLSWRYRLGYPAKGQCGARASKLVDTVGPQFFAILEGKQTRPVCWVALAQQRIRLVEPGATLLALKIKAWELSQLGVHETCGGSCNLGTVRNGLTSAGLSVNDYERRFGLLGLAWCEIFQEYGFEQGGYHPIPFSPVPYGVIGTYQWAAAHNLVSAKARVGSLVAFLGDGGHIGYVIKLVGGSGYVTVEGNYGDAVREVFHPWNDRLRVFINLPSVA